MGTDPKDPQEQAGGAVERTLDNGRYTVHLNARGTGWSGFGDRLVTSGADYPERDGGVRVYVRDLDDRAWWPASAGVGGRGPQAGGDPREPRTPDRFEARLEADPPRFVRTDGDVETTVEVALAEGAAAEIRRITVANRGSRRRTLEVTTAVPVALDAPAAYAGHPAFSKLFIETEYLPALQGLLARRRPRNPDDPPVSAVHLLVPDADAADPPAFETDRARFLGRGRSLADPIALACRGALSGTAGSVLDPVLALRRTVVLEPGGAATLAAVVAAGTSAEEAMAAARASTGGGAEPFGGGGDRGGVRWLAVRDGASRSATGGSEEGEEGGEDVDHLASEALLFDNGVGGFAASGREYVIRLGAGPDGLKRPPQPWINVVANERIGFLASESGAGYTWAGNSRLNRLTPWFNDPVTDPHGEAVYLRDEEDGAFWSSMPGPTPGAGPYEARHGFGYSRWRHESRGLDQQTWQLVAREEPVKLLLLKVTNRSARPRRLSAFGYFEWVLGGGADARRTVVAEAAEALEGSGLVLARNPETEDFEDAVAFAGAMAVAGGIRSTASRSGFLGPDGRLAAPAAVASGRPLESGARPARGDDACAAFQAPLTLEPGETGWVAFQLGQASSEEAARELFLTYATPDAVRAELARVAEEWSGLLDRVVVETPSKALDLMLNGWLPYQDLACRLRGRSAFYQSGGAYGYRDQLQDVTGLIYHDPALARRQILLHAAHQFPEGDVLHWWHPPASRGIRTRFSDDLLWLPYILGFYLDVTGDGIVLDERAPFVTGPELDPGEDERYFRPGWSEEDASVFEHACLAIDRSLTRGRNGLPLMGTGDWNDGMNRVGREGKGESVWLGFFLASILHRWIPLCRERGDDDRADRYAAYLAGLEDALNDAGWDGDWYRRAFYDSGAAMGSAGSDECRIDAIAQAWSVLSGVAPTGRAEEALDALEARLVDEEAGIIRLLTPPFDRTPHDPGYIKGYVPGVRENGGQYTHGVLWAIRALAEAGRTERAARLLEMLLPVHHARTPEAVERYRVEPYVVAADVYGAPPHVGRGGWTWYTGSAGWMYRIALESILGLEIRGGSTLRLRPCIPDAWPGYRIDYRLPGSDTRYRIHVSRGGGAETAGELDGAPVKVRGGVPEVELVDDGGSHVLEVRLGRGARPRYAPASTASSARREPST